MKKLKYMLALILCTSIILSGCKEKIEIPIEELPLITLTWTNSNELKNIDMPYLGTQYESKFIPLEIEADLSNIENAEELLNLSEEEIKELAENGFLIDSENLSLDNNRFITSDLVLYNYYEIYNEIISYIEENHLFESLKILTYEMLEKSIKVSKLITDPSLIDIANENITYFLVANMLVNGNSYVDLDLNDSIIELARKEYEFIKKGEGDYYSPLFDKQLDYSQFKTRNHYNKNEAFDRFYMVRKWYSFAPMQLMVNQEKGLNVENVQKTLLLSYIAFVNNDSNKNSIDLWNQIYSPVSLFSSREKNINIMDIKEIIVKVFGEDFNINEIGNKGHFASLFEEIRKLSNKDNTEKQFSFMDDFDSISQDVLEHHKLNLINEKDLFINNEPWNNKITNTLLGSYYQFESEEIKYIDNEINIVPTLFIEPNVELYSKLLWLMNNNITNLELRGLLNEELITKSKDFIDLLEFIINCSIKELNNESFTEDEKEALDKILLRNFEDSSSVYVIVPFEEKLYLTKGIVYQVLKDNIIETVN